MIAAILALALAHESGVSSSRIDPGPDGLRVTFTFSLEDLASLARLDSNRDGIVEPDEWKQALPAIFSYLGDHFRIDGCRSDGDPGTVPGRIRSSDLRAPVSLVLRYTPSTRLDRLKIRCDLLREHGGNPRHVAELPGGTIVFDAGRIEAERPLASSDVQWPWTAGAFALIAAMIPVYLSMSRSA